MSADIDVYKEWLAIPEGPRPPDHYTLLRLVQFEDSADKIRANYKKLNAHVRKYATGQYSERSQELLNELAKAMLCLTDAERKREYDVSLGREFDEDQTVRKTVDAILIEQGHVSREQAKEAEAYADQMGLELRDAFVQLKMVEPPIAAQALAQELGLPYVDLNDMIPEDNVLDLVPKTLVKQNSLLPLFVDNDVVLVACANQIDSDLEQELRLRFDLPVRSVLAAPRAIEQGIARYYAPGLRKEPPKPGEKRKAAAKDAGGKPAGKDTVTADSSGLSAKERKEARKKNRMTAILIACWGLIGAVLITNILLPMFMSPNHPVYKPLWWGILLGLPPIALAVAYLQYWNKDTP